MHDEMRELLSAYVDGEVTNKEKQNVEEHLEYCQECRMELEELLWLKQEMSTLYAIEPDEQFEQAVRNEIHKYKQQTAMSRKKVAAISFVAFLLLGALLLQISSVMYVIAKFVFVLMNIGVSVLHALGAILPSVPYLAESLVLTVILILLFSGWTIRRLLMTKTIA